MKLQINLYKQNLVFKSNNPKHGLLVYEIKPKYLENYEQSKLKSCFVVIIQMPFSFSITRKQINEKFYSKNAHKLTN
ncbi:hypothetical protein [Campylobacter sp.]|uniref:hypothetical protein n=1 Tax=Campylobacter sp. TaxID=205 RepID=UPI0029307810|nr:hypothetical protein [Campylobacter sp.]